MSVKKYYAIKYEMILKTGSELPRCAFPSILFCSFHVRLANNFHEWICISQRTISHLSRFALHAPVWGNIKLSGQI